MSIHENASDISIYYKLIVDNSQDLILIISISDNPQILFFSQSFIKVLGFDLEMIKDRFFQQMVHPEDKHILLDGLNNIMVKVKFFSKDVLGPPKNVVVRIKNNLNQWRHFDVIANRIDDKVLIVGRDISDKISVEETLLGSKKKISEEKALTERYLDIAGVIILAIGTDQNIIMINKKGCEILGCNQKDIVGKNWFDNFIASEERAAVKDAFVKLISDKDESVKYFENRIMAKTGELRLVAWHNTFIKDDKGRIIGTLSSGEDITEKKKNENELLIRNHELERFNKLSVGRELKMIELKEKIKELEYQIKKLKNGENIQDKT